MNDDRAILSDWILSYRHKLKYIRLVSRNFCLAAGRLARKSWDGGVGGGEGEVEGEEWDENMNTLLVS